MTKSELKQAIRAWFVAAAGMTADKVYLDKIQGPKPDRPFAVISITTPTIRIGHDERLTGPAVGGAATVQLTGHRRATASLQVFSDEAEDTLEAVRQSQYLRTANAIAQANDIVIQEVTDTRDLTGILDTGWEKRAAVDVRVGWKYTVVSATEAGGTIERVIGNGQVDDGDRPPLDAELDEEET